MNSKEMPHNIDAEKSVLGSMFLSKYALQKTAEELTDDSFYSQNNGIIFKTICSLAENHLAIDLTTVTAELEKNKTLKAIGDVEYLTEIVNFVPTAANIDQYIKIVKETEIRRNLIETATNIATEGFKSTDDITDILDKSEQQMLNVIKKRSSSEFKKIKDVLYKTQADLETLSANKKEITGVPSGFFEIDKITAGFHENELIILAARPAMGKTALALNMAVNAAMNYNKTVAIFNMEMGAEQLTTRMLASIGQIDINKLRTGRLEHDDWKRVNEAISRLTDTKLYIDDTSGMTVSEIKAKCRRLSASETGLDLVIIDYLQLISGSAKYAGQRTQEVSEISRSLKTLAMELNVPVIALAQLSRSVEGREDKRPLLSDLKESGSIEQDADIVSFLYRDSYYNKTEVTEGDINPCEFIIGKHRSGPTATVELAFKGRTSSFFNLDKGVEE